MAERSICRARRPYLLIGALADRERKLDTTLDVQGRQLQELHSERKLAIERAKRSRNALESLRVGVLNPARLRLPVYATMGTCWLQGRRQSRRQRRLHLRWRLAGLQAWRLVLWVLRCPARIGGAVVRLARWVWRVPRGIGRLADRVRRPRPEPSDPTAGDDGP